MIIIIYYLKAVSIVPQIVTTSIRPEIIPKAPDHPCNKFILKKIFSKILKAYDKKQNKGMKYFVVYAHRQSHKDMQTMKKRCQNKGNQNIGSVQFFETSLF